MDAPRSSARLAIAAALAVVLVLLGLSELAGARDDAAPDEIEVDRDVEPARARLAASLLAIEKACADAAALALRRTAEVSDASALFDALAGVSLPDGAGLFLEDANGRVLAWAGATIDDAAFAAMPRTTDGSWLVETPASRRLAVRRTRSSPRTAEGVPFLAVCHRTFVESFPLRNRALTAFSVENDVARQFRVAEEVSVLPPDSPDGEPLRSAFGGTLAKLDVHPLPAQSWNEAVDAAAARRRALLLASLVVVAAVALWREAGRAASPARAYLARAGTVLAARAALGLLALSNAADLGPVTEASRYSHALPLDVAGSPVSLALTCVAVCLAAACVRRAARETRARPGSMVRSIALVAAVALACRSALQVLVGDVVANSKVEFFSQDTILPRAASTTLLLCLLAAGIAAVLLVEAAWTAFPPSNRPSPPRALGISLLVAALLAPIPFTTPHATALAAAALAGFGAAIASVVVGSGVALRAAAIPLGTAVALFAPLEGSLHLATRDAVGREAAERISRTVAVERFFVSDTLEGAAKDPRLLAALRTGGLPHDLALSLWAASPLARRAAGSSLEIEPLPGRGERQLFSADLPPRAWLPDASLGPPPGEVATELLAGRASGRDGLWIVGETKVLLDGTEAAILHVLLEVRPPAPTLPELQILGATRATDARETPQLWVTHYAPDGHLVESNDPYRSAGEQLDGEVHRRAVDDRGETWLESTRAGHELQVLVKPELVEGEVVAIHAFSYDSGGPSALLLRGTRAALCGALVSLVALLATVRSWARRARLRLAQRLVISYVVVTALPLAVLGWANQRIAENRAEETTQRELNEAMSLLVSALHERQALLEEIADVTRPSPSLRSVAYAIGHHANVFIGAHLRATSDQGLFDTELLPKRLPGVAYRSVFLLGQPFEKIDAAVGGYHFDVGYAPLRVGPEGEVIGAVSVPLLHQRRQRERELAGAVTAALGVYLATLIAAIGIGTWLARRLTKPLSDLTDAAKRVARGDLAHPVAGAGPDELGEVVTAFNQMQRDLGESRARLVKAEKESAWRDMARQVAHEVKNPLTPMRLAAEHLRRAWRDKVPQFDVILERGVDLIVRQTESLQRIATAFSDFARFPNRRREPVDLATLTDEVLDLYREVPDLEVRRRIERPSPALSADPDELRRVLVNLAKNAVEAMEGRKGTLTVTLARAGDALVLTLADDGPGIPDEILPRLFEPYLSTKTKGTGLGLAICKRAIDDLGGTIVIESRRGEGTTVTVTLPLPAAG